MSGPEIMLKVKCPICNRHKRAVGSVEAPVCDYCLVDMIVISVYGSNGELKATAPKPVGPSDRGVVYKILEAMKTELTLLGHLWMEAPGKSIRARDVAEIRDRIDKVLTHWIKTLQYEERGKADAEAERQNEEPEA